MSYATRYGCNIPKILNHFKEPQEDTTRHSLFYEFSNYKCHHQRYKEFEPRQYLGIGTPLPGYEEFRIYHRSSGIIPNYAGHVPGEKLQYGKTFTKSTVDARQWL